MIYFHWWAVPSRSPINFGRALKIRNPKYTDMVIQVFKLWSHGMLFSNNGLFYVLHLSRGIPFACLFNQSNNFQPVFQMFLCKIFFFKHKGENLIKSQDSKRWNLKRNIILWPSMKGWEWVTLDSLGEYLFTNKVTTLTLDLNARYLIFLLF